MTVLRSNSLRRGVWLSLALVLAGAGVVVAQEDPAAVVAQEVPAEVVAQEVPAAGVVQEAPAAADAVVVETEEVVLGAGSTDAAVDVGSNAAGPAPADQPAGTEAEGPLIQTLGEADQKIFLVDHKGTWSMHFENVITANVVLQWKQAGGPDVTMKTPVDRPFTMSVHKLEPEMIVERLFEGYGYTLHYDDAGRLTSVRVYSPRESLAFKTPRLTQSLSDWKKAETESQAAAAQPPPQP
jgi:hypothetical protein